MKKILTLGLALLMVVMAIASCKDTGDPSESSGDIPTKPPVESSTPKDTESEPTPSETDPIVIAPIEFEDCDEKVYVVNTEFGLKLRTSTSFDNEANVADIVDPGTELRRIGYHETWSKVVYENKEYYTSTRYLSTEEPGEVTDPSDSIVFADRNEMVCIKTGYEDGQANIYSKPSKNALITDMVLPTEGTEVKRTGISYDIEGDPEQLGWSRIEYMEKVCYIRNSVVVLATEVQKVDGIEFAAPKSWVKAEAEGMIIFTDATTNNNIVYTSTAKTDEFDDITAEEFESQMNAATAQTGVSVSGTVVTEGKNANKIKITKVTYTATVAAEGVQISMGQTMLVFTVGEKTYTVTVTETAPDVTLAGIVFDSINKAE